jgi:hypothetical protein
MYCGTEGVQHQNINNFKIALVLRIHNLNIVRLILSKKIIILLD